MKKNSLGASRTPGLLILLFASSVLGTEQNVWSQVMVSPAFDELKNEAKQRPQVDVNPDEDLSVRAAKAPTPLLRYRLWPAVEERRDESVNDILSRAIILTIQASQEDDDDPAANDPLLQNLYDWEDLPLSELPIEKAKKAIGPYGFALAELKRGESLMRVEYELHLDELSVSQLAGILLPEVQEARLLSQILCLRARVAAAEHRWDDMIDDCRLGFRLAEIIGRSTDFLVSRLVGQYIARSMMWVIKDAITQSNPPNLYWALAALPMEKILETKDSVEFESIFLTRFLSRLADLPDAPLGEEAARKKLLELIQTGTELNGPLQTDARDQLAAGLKIVALAERSRKILANTDAWRNRVDDLSDCECVLRALDLEGRRMRDEIFAWSYLPDYAWRESHQERQAIRAETANLFSPLAPLVEQMTPQQDSPRQQKTTQLQTYHLILTLEALRMHAAKTGELPESLKNLRPVPVWHDPVTQKNFKYQRMTFSTATIRPVPVSDWQNEETLQITLKWKP